MSILYQSAKFNKISLTWLSNFQNWLKKEGVDRLTLLQISIRKRTAFICFCIFFFPFFLFVCFADLFLQMADAFLLFMQRKLFFLNANSKGAKYAGLQKNPTKTEL